MVQRIKKSNDIWPGERKFRLMTDLSRPFFAVVTEANYESLCTWEADLQKYCGDARFPTWFKRMVQLLENGRRKFYTLVEKEFSMNAHFKSLASTQWVADHLYDHGVRIVEVIWGRRLPVLPPTFTGQSP